ncbi:MAG: DUF2721 domain-containing protein [Bacteroidales bacterium]|nr:DUF2721 domain-containing protein [Bacteroidales bacterium]
MESLTLTTPTLLFSAISLILLAYTNRFLAYATLVRSLAKEYQEKKDSIFLAQIKNLQLRLHLTRAMQIFGIASLLLCVLSMFLIFVNALSVAEVVFAIALALLILSLVILIWEIQISHVALKHHLKNIEKDLLGK